MPRTTKAPDGQHPATPATPHDIRNVMPATGKGRAAADVLIEVLAAHSGTTAADLARLAGLGGSTVTKILAGLEKDGLARRDTSHGAPSAGRRPAARWALTSATQEPSGSPTEPTEDPTSDGERLRKGRLSELVLEYLIAHPETDLGPTAIGKALNRSQGAVANALAKFAATGDIVQSSDKPRRYRLAG